MSHARDWRVTLSTTAEARGINLSQSDLQNIKLASDESDLARWVKSTLKDDRLLSQEELQIWKHIEKKKPKVKVHEHNSHFVSIPSNEEDLQNLVRSLEASTKAIEAHAQVLEQQQHYLTAHVKEYGSSDTIDSSVERNHQRKQESEAQHLAFMNSEVVAELELRLNTIQDKANKVLKTIPSVVSEKLKADDRILESLEESVNKATDTTEDDEPAQQTRVDQLLSALQQAMTQSLKDRLDRIYLEEIARSATDNPTASFKTSTATVEQEQQVKQDLEILYTEIDDVAAILIQHEHGAHLAQAMRSARLKKAQRSSNSMRQVHDELVSLAQNLNDLAQRYESLQAYRVLAEHMQASLQHVQKQHKPMIELGTDITIDRAGSAPKLTALMQHLNIDLSDRSSHQRLQDACVANLTDIHSRIRRAVSLRARDAELLGSTDIETLYDESREVIRRLDQSTMEAKERVQIMAKEDDNAILAREDFVRKYTER